jgi:hypothetical protein
MSRRRRWINTTLLACSIVVLALLAGAARPANDARPAAGETTSAKLTSSMTALIDGQPGPYRAWVFFADKGVQTQRDYEQAIAAVGAGYNPRAVERRRLRGNNAVRGGALFDARDLPLVEAYVNAVENTGASLRVQSTWLNAVSVEASAAQIETIAALPFVTKVQPVARSAGGSGPRAGRPAASSRLRLFDGAAPADQPHQPARPRLHRRRRHRRHPRHGLRLHA